MNFKTINNTNFDVLVSNVAKLDASNASELKEQFNELQKNSRNKIILDMSLTKYCDSSGLSAILLGHRFCRDTNGKFVLIGVQPMVEKLIKIAQLDTVLSFSENVEEAEREMK